MAIDLQKGISLKIEGELGKFQTLPVEALIKIAESLQELVMSIAKYDLPANEAVDLNNFKLELTDFQKGSAIPSFVLTERVQTVISSDYQQQRNEVTKKLNSLFEISDKGNYNDLRELYPDHLKRNEIVEKLFDFTSSFKNSPVSIYEKGNVQENSEKYRLKTFNSSTKKSLIVDLKEVNVDKSEEKAFARIKITKSGGKTTNRIEEVISTAKHSLSYSPEAININNKEYLLKFPLRCLFEKEDNYYIIHNEQLDIIGTGLTQDEAEQNFNEEFDYLFNRLNSLEDNQLNKRMLRIKSVLNSFVERVN